MDAHHLSFATQAFRYFAREHEAVRKAPIGGPSAWRGAELRGRDDWQIRLDEAQIAELDRARAAVRARRLTLAAIGRDEFALPTLGPVIETWSRELDRGRGFLLLRGLPVERWGDDDAALVFWGLGQHLGEPGAQNPMGDLLGHVTDLGEDAAKPLVRLYRTAAHIDWHCDLADVVGLLCLRTAKRGGASRIVSSVAVYDELVRRRPDLVDRLYEPFALDSRDEQGERSARSSRSRPAASRTDASAPSGTATTSAPRCATPKRRAGTRAPRSWSRSTTRSRAIRSSCSRCSSSRATCSSSRTT